MKPIFSTRSFTLAFAVTLVAGAQDLMSSEDDNPEQSVCGAVHEPLAFWLWRSTAGSDCPEEFDPVHNFPEDASNLLVIAGGNDEVVPTGDVEEMLALAEARGGKAIRREDFNHPCMDPPSVHRERLELIRRFLAED